MASWMAIATSSCSPWILPVYVLPNVVFGGSTTIAKFVSSERMTLSASLTPSLSEKKCVDSWMLPSSD